MQRRLAAILAADVVGYSKLMGEDQTRTLDTLRLVRKGLFEPVVDKHLGRVIKNMGDGWLVEFPSIIDAVNGAIEIQQGMVDHNQLRLRIGVHIGDVVFEEEDVFGDGVNIAARLEAMALPGEVLISDTAYHSLDGKAAKQFSGGETHKLKNIARPVAVWHWAKEKITPQVDDRETKSIPDKPSIAVLPFDNMSDDPEQVFFADGIVEDIITELSRYHWLLVIARNTSFTFKGMPVDIKDVGRRLNVRYVMEGSIRKSGDRARITAQLIDTQSGGHVWAEKYDRELADIFAVQDEITQAVAGAIQPELFSAEVAHSRRKRPENLLAWDYAVRGRWHILRVSRKDNLEGQRLLREGLEIYPDDVSLLAFLSFGLLSGVLFGWSDDPGGWIAGANKLAQKAAKLDDNDVWVQCALGFCQFMAKQPKKAIAHYNKAISLSPSFALCHGYLALQLSFAGEPADAIKAANTAIRLSPHDPELFHFFVAIGTAHFVAGRYEEAAEWAEKSVRERPDAVGPLRLLTSSLAQLGRTDEAKTALARVLEIVPSISATGIRNAIHFGNAEALERYIDGMCVAGLPK